MLFNSYAFLLFLPLVWAVYFFCNRMNWFRCAQLALAAASFIFYGFEDYRLCFLLAFSIGSNYLLHILLTRQGMVPLCRKLFLCLGILLNLGLLFYFKYLDFTLTNVNRLLGTGYALHNIALPLGISFYTFQQLSFVIDSYHRDMERYGLLEYTVFVSFFPQLIAGPIVLHQEMIPQLRDAGKKKVDPGNMLAGAEYFIIGLAKKVLVADSFARLCDVGYENISQLSSFCAVLTILSYTLEIYFDFSGYCDMAIGLGRFFNIEIPINFDSPYKARSISEFWKRWHMTLTRFLTTYIYIPLGGNRKGMLRTCVNVMLVFTVSGLWHGAAWTFVFWGMLHGAAMVLHRLFTGIWEKVPGWIAWAATFLFVNIAWVFFRAEYFRQAYYLLKRVITGGLGGVSNVMAQALCQGGIGWILGEAYLPRELLMGCARVITLVWAVIWTVVCVKAPSTHELVKRKRRGTGWFVWLSSLFTLAFYCMSQLSKFIYFNF